MVGTGLGLIENQLEEVMRGAVGEVMFFGVLPVLGRREEHV